MICRACLLGTVLLVAAGAITANAREASVSSVVCKDVKASSSLNAGYSASKVIDSVVSDDSRWVSEKGKTNVPWLEVHFDQTTVNG